MDDISYVILVIIIVMMLAIVTQYLLYVYICMGDTCHMCIYVCMYTYTYNRYHPYMHRYDKYCITMASIVTIILTSNNNNIS